MLRQIVQTKLILVRHLCNLLGINMSNQNQKCSDKHQIWSENVRCPTTISTTVEYTAHIRSFSIRELLYKATVYLYIAAV